MVTMIDDKTREIWLSGLPLESLEKLKKMLEKDLKIINKKIKERVKK